MRGEERAERVKFIYKRRERGEMETRGINRIERNKASGNEESPYRFLRSSGNPWCLRMECDTISQEQIGSVQLAFKDKGCYHDCYICYAYWDVSFFTFWSKREGELKSLAKYEKSQAKRKAS
jgi:hypothetical protein